MGNELEESPNLTCTEPKCKRSFPNAILVRNIGEKTTYYGCPYCLTKIDETPAECLHHFGYLCERSRGEAIPEACMTCEKVVGCMLSELKKTEAAIKEIRKWYR